MRTIRLEFWNNWTDWTYGIYSFSFLTVNHCCNSISVLIFNFGIGVDWRKR